MKHGESMRSDFEGENQSSPLTNETVCFELLICKTS